MHPLSREWRPTYFYRMALRGILMRLRLLTRRARHFVVHGILRADDPPGRLAMGAAIGVFVAVTPTIGLQMMLVVLLAWLVRANKVIGVPLVWITNPATIVPIYYPCYVVGRAMLGEKPVRLNWWRQLQYPPEGWLPALQFYWIRMLEIALPLWLGCLLVGSMMGVATYYLVYFGICRYRLRRWGQLVPPQANRIARRARSG